MSYDLNIMWTPSTTPSQLLQLLSLASSFGYDTVALNHTLGLPFPANPVAPFPSTSSLLASTTSTTKTSNSSNNQRLPAILHRATLPLADPAASNYRLPSLASVYDILAIRPLTAKAFQSACLTLDVPIISLDMTQHFDFHFRPKPCMAAVARGVRFEVCYAQALAPGADPRARANFIGNVTGLVRATRGRGIILSSEAGNALSLRAPADVVNLLSVWGLSTDKAMEGLRTIPRSVVVNEAIKRTGFRGVIDIVETAAPADPDNSPDDRSAKKNKKQNNSNNNKNQNQNQNQKRKGDNEAEQPTSKRQAKKMRLASRTADSDKK